MKLPEPQMWAVQVRRDSVCTVYVRTADPAEAREAALVLAEDFETTEHAAAYVLDARPNDRYWTGGPEGHWVYPETELFDEGEK